MNKHIPSVFAAALLLSPGVHADGDPAAGEDLFKRCQSCHTIDEGGRAKQGPNLFGVYGRTAGTSEGFDRYSDGVASSGIVWDEETLSAWLQGPAQFIAGAKMTFRLNDPQDIADVIAYLKANSPDAE
jgi:cytochrome c2